jgi:ABC-type multidrug transport system ATPase subunit
MSDEPVVRTRNLTKLYGARRAVSGLELVVPKGSVYGLLGQNGAGKSTTIRMLLGLTPPTAGEVLLFGRSLARERLALLPRVGCLVDGPAFYPFLSGEKNLELLGSLTGPVTRARVREVLERVGLGVRGADRYKGYSTGMRQRLGIAAALLHDPELVVLDEPVNGLDPPAVLLVRNLIRDLAAREGKTVLVSSHLLHEVELTCDRVAIVEQGQLVAEGRVADLLREAGGLVEVELAAGADGAKALSVAKAVEGVTTAEATPNGLRLVLSAPVEAAVNRALVTAGLDVRAFVPRKRSLEDLYYELAAKAGGGAGVAGAQLQKPAAGAA